MRYSFSWLEKNSKGLEYCHDDNFVDLNFNRYILQAMFHNSNRLALSPIHNEEFVFSSWRVTR